MELTEIPGNGWIWIPSWNEFDEKEATFVYFRKDIDFNKVPESYCIKVSADSRYKIYINNRFIEAGPSKGDGQIWFYDEIEIAPFMKEGKNILAVIVLRYPLDHNKGNHGTYRTNTPGLYLDSCDMINASGIPVIKADKSWKCKKAKQIKIVSENLYFAPLQIYEQVKECKETFGWMEDFYQDEEWESAQEYNLFTMSKNVSPGRLLPRTIPLLQRIPRTFSGISRLGNTITTEEHWKEFLAGENFIVVPPQTQECIEIDAGELTTGYLKLLLSGGAGTRITMLQSECYAKEPEEDENPFKCHPVKGDRSDAENGMLFGFTDEYHVCGLGNSLQPEVYEPFWFRTFRYIRLTIETTKEPLTLVGLDYQETGYPLEIKSWVKTSDSTMHSIWDLCARTLRRCMHETYEDCPFYEQLQYAMDSRSQILYTYAVSADDRLARKCMDDFRRSRRYDGMLNCSYPNFGPNIIPGFSIYYIGMLYDHMMYFGDIELIRYHMPVVDGVLDYFNRQLNEQGIVGKNGGINRPDQYWSFIDWTKEWDATSGAPTATLKGPITMESLLYILGLQYAEALSEYIGRSGMAAEYKLRAEKMQKAVNQTCRGRNGLYQDGPGVEEYSQHCQVFAVLTDIVSIEKGRELLEETLINKENYAQCTVAMMYYLFRAMEKCGLYEYTQELWDIWRDMITNHLTTCAEDPLQSRSDCHAWGSLALYELPSVILGVRPFKPGYDEVLVDPNPALMKWAEGEAVTPNGMLKVRWEKKQEDTVELTIVCPEDMKIVLPEHYSKAEIIRE